MTRIPVVAALAALAVAAPAEAAPYLNKSEARDVIIKNFPANAPRMMLQDERARFFSTARLIVVPAARCQRQNSRRVACNFSAVLRPDAAHRKANWWPIRCAGSQRVFEKDDEGHIGTMGHYKCVTIRP